MENIITLSIGIGLVISLIFSEMLGVAAGGMVVPGYVALYYNHPFSIVMTILISYFTYFIVHSMSSLVIIYGRRRTVSMILVGFLLGWLSRSFGSIQLSTQVVDLQIVGYIIPGLIAIWMDRQGVLETVTALITSSVLVRLLLIIFIGKEILQK